MKSYGYFDNAHREYVITNPKTPVKWINYIGTLAFGGYVDQTGGMLICKQDPALNRITKYLTQGPPLNLGGRRFMCEQPGNTTIMMFSRPFLYPQEHPLTGMNAM